MSDLIISGLCSFPRASVAKYHRLDGWLKQKKFIFSHFWRLEVQDQGGSRVGFSPGPLSSPRWSSSLRFLHMVSPVCTSLCPNLLFLQGHQSYWIRAYLNDLILT